MRSSHRSSSNPSHKLLPLNYERTDQFSQLVELVEPSRERSELILSRQNNEILDITLDEFRHADTLRRHGLTNRSKILLCGPPGCGKTFTAEMIARQTGLPLYVAKVDAIISSFLGETASNVRKLFDAANERACVLFLDEFDALARARSSNDEHNELRRVVNSLLMMIDRYSGRGLLIAATNLEDSLDSAIWRRFDDVLFLELPRLPEIRAYLKFKTRNFPTEFNVEKKASKLLGLSYADIERVCLSGIKRAILGKSLRLEEQQFDTALLDEKRRQKARAQLKAKPATRRR